MAFRSALRRAAASALFLVLFAESPRAQGVAPTVLSVTPPRALPVGGVVATITGSGFVPGATAVVFGATTSPGVVVLNPSTLRASVPLGSLGTVTVRVTTPLGSGELPAGFTYVSTGAHAYEFKHFAGTVGGPGRLDGTGAQARFNGPAGILIDPGGDLLIADTFNGSIRRVSPGGVVTTFMTPRVAAGDYFLPSVLSLSPSGELHVIDTFNNAIRRVSPAGVATTLAGAPGQLHGAVDGPGNDARFYGPRGAAFDSAGNLYVADTYNHAIRRITPAGDVLTIAGALGIPGHTDGAGANARFNQPMDLTVDDAGRLYVADYLNACIRLVTVSGEVTTVPQTVGFAYPVTVVSDTAGNLFVGTWQEVQRIAPSGVRTRVGGTVSAPQDLAVGASGELYVTDWVGDTVSRVEPSGLWTILAGRAGETGSADGAGPNARFTHPQGVAADTVGNLYVADTANQIVRKVTPAGLVTTLAGAPNMAGHADGFGSNARFWNPEGIAVDPVGNVYVADTGSHTVRKVTPLGGVTTLAGLAGEVGSADGTGAGARFNSPEGVAVDREGNVYVADTLNYTIRKVTPGGIVTTVAGVAGASARQDGIGVAARFNRPVGIAVDSLGNLYVADSQLRKISPDRLVTTLIPSGVPVWLAAAVAVDPADHLFVADEVLGLLYRVTTENIAVLGGGRQASDDGVGIAAGFDHPSGLAVDASGTLFVADAYNSAIRSGALSHFEPPSLTSMTPMLGSAAGGGRATVQGANLLFGAAATLAGQPMLGTTYEGPESLSVLVPPADFAGPVDLVVTNPDGQSATLANAFAYTSPTDTDGDALQDAWEIMHFGGLAQAAFGDPDRDGFSNLQEQQADSNPLEAVRNFAEGANGEGMGFATRIALMNPHEIATAVTLEFQPRSGAPVTHGPLTLGPLTRATVETPRHIPALASASFSTIVRSRLAVVADRTMTWDASGYGSHAETGVIQPSTRWYFAEGATHSGFRLFYLLQNPTDTDAIVTVTYLIAGEGPLPVSCGVPAHSRVNIFANAQLCPDGLARTVPFHPTALVDKDVSAIFEVANDVPILVERAMYTGASFNGGTVTSGVTSASTRWFLAEGATGDLFDTYVLLGNPNPSPARFEVDLLRLGSTPSKLTITTSSDPAFCRPGTTPCTLLVPPYERRTIYLDGIAGVENVGVSTVVRVTNGVPLLVERAMWWPGGPSTWTEGHASFGTTQTGTLWGLADGEVGGPSGASTYVLVANASDIDARVRARLVFEDGVTPPADVVIDVPANSRANVNLTPGTIAGYPGLDVVFPPAVVAAGKRFGVVVESLAYQGAGDQPVAAQPIVVERAMYSSDGRTPTFFPYWPAGTNAVATKLR